jgi:hypothetical protein
MGTKVLQMATVHAQPEHVADLLEDLLTGRNISPPTMYEKYVVSVKKECAALLVEVDDGSVYRVVVERTR